MRKLFLFLTAAFLLLGGCQRGPRPALINTTAPDFALRDSDRSVSLRDLRGQIVVLNFWATWCPPCVEEMPSLVALQQRMKGRVTVLAVSVDLSEDAYRRFLRDHNIDLMTVRDPDQKANSLYGTVRFPETYVIDATGVLRRKFIGPVEWTHPEMLDYLGKL
ncbi:MAG: TlpA family protein disulfide reductase [Terriglobales bacterium]